MVCSKALKVAEYGVPNACDLDRPSLIFAVRTCNSVPKQALTILIIFGFKDTFIRQSKKGIEPFKIHFKV